MFTFACRIGKNLLEIIRNINTVFNGTNSLCIFCEQYKVFMSYSFFLAGIKEKMKNFISIILKGGVFTIELY